MTRREWLARMLAAGAVGRAAPGVLWADTQTAATAELILCGWDEVFILELVNGTPVADRKVWSWRATERPEIPAALQQAFRTTDDCKPVEDGRRILISSSSGAVGLIDRATKRSIFHAPVINAHSVERLPDGRIVAAASVSTSPGGNRLVVFDPASGQELASDDLRSAHGLVWDDARAVLWALGGDVLRAYGVRGTGAATRLERTFELPLPDRGGHDLTPIPGSPRLFVSTEQRCWYFDRDTRQITPHDTLGAQAGIKSYVVHPRTGRVAYVQAEGANWWAEHVHFERPDGLLRLPGERLYKARWG